MAGVTDKNSTISGRSERRAGELDGVCREEGCCRTAELGIYRVRMLSVDAICE